MKTKLLLLLTAVCCGRSFSQPYTGMTLYDHVGITPILTAGTYVTSNPGFLMAGWNPIVVDKVDVDGLFNNSPGEFSMQYSISSGGITCSSNLSPQGGNGVSIVETFQGPIQYAMATAVNTGQIIAFLDNTGNIVSSNFYPFPISTSSVIKSIILESTVSPGNYYVMGAYYDATANCEKMYLIYTNTSFTSGWSSTYDIGSGTMFNPRSMVESTFGGATGELLIAGMLNVNQNAMDGFVLTLDIATNGTINQFNRYYSNGNNWDWFHCIELAASNNGYMVGGFTASNPSNGYGWMARLNTSGTIDWSSQINFSSNANSGVITDIIERLNTSMSYEYYGLTQPPAAGMQICKLQNNGTAGSGGNFDEFMYKPSLATDIPISFSYENTAGNVNEGLHSFGLTLSGNNEFSLVQSCFNGASGNTNNLHQVLKNLTSVTTGPTNVTSVTANISAGLTTCPNFQILATPIVVIANHVPGYLNNIWPSNPFPGNNAKYAAAVGLDDLEGDLTKNLMVYPNPAKHACHVKCNFSQNAQYFVQILNPIGEVVREYASTASQENHEVEINVEGLMSGIYLIKLNSENLQKEFKVVVESD